MGHVNFDSTSLMYPFEISLYNNLLGINRQGHIYLYDIQASNYIKNLSNTYDTIDYISNPDTNKKFYATKWENKNCYTSTISILENLLSEKEYDIYPNPFRNEVNVEFKNNNETFNNNYYIFDINGKLVNEGVLINRNNKINLNNMENGVYIITIKIKDRWHSERIISAN